MNDRHSVVILELYDLNACLYEDWIQSDKLYVKNENLHSISTVRLSIFKLYLDHLANPIVPA